MIETQPDTTGHDRTRPDTKPDISDTAEHDTVQNTPDTTGHYRTLPDTTGHYQTLPDTTGHEFQTCYRTCYRTQPDMLPDMTGHDRTSRTTGHPRLSSRFATGLGGALGRCLASSTLSTPCIWLMSPPVTVHVALGLGLASKAITAIGPTDAHTGPCFPGGVFSFLVGSWDGGIYEA